MTKIEKVESIEIMVSTNPVTVTFNGKKDKHYDIPPEDIPVCIEALKKTLAQMEKYLQAARNDGTI